LTYFDKIWYSDPSHSAIRDPSAIEISGIKNSQVTAGQHSEKPKNLDISAIILPILMKFGVMMHQ